MVSQFQKIKDQLDGCGNYSEQTDFLQFFRAMVSRGDDLTTAGPMYLESF
jgi:hypothetical protein